MQKISGMFGGKIMLRSGQKNDPLGQIFLCRSRCVGSANPPGQNSTGTEWGEYRTPIICNDSKHNDVLPPGVRQAQTLSDVPLMWGEL